MVMIARKYGKVMHIWEIPVITSTHLIRKGLFNEEKNETLF